MPFLGGGRAAGQRRGGFTGREVQMKLYDCEGMWMYPQWLKESKIQVAIRAGFWFLAEDSPRLVVRTTHLPKAVDVSAGFFSTTSLDN